MMDRWNGTRRTRSVYPRLEKWIELHYSNYSELARVLGIHRSTLYDIMDGKSDPKKSLIDAILYETGMSYEECFGGKKHVQQ